MVVAFGVMVDYISDLEIFVFALVSDLVGFAIWLRFAVGVADIWAFDCFAI